MGVRTNGGTNAFSTLSPRQELTPAPYGLVVATALTVAESAIGPAQLADIAVTGAKIQNGAVSNEKVQDATLTADKIAAGQVVKTVNSLTDAVTLAAGTNISLVTDGNNLIISSTGGGAGDPGAALRRNGNNGIAGAAGNLSGFVCNTGGGWSRWGGDGRHPRPAGRDRGDGRQGRDR